MRFYSMIYLLGIPLWMSYAISNQGEPIKDIVVIDTLREELPISIDYDNHTVTPTINIEIDNKVFTLVFDSGSYGVRVLRGAFAKKIPDTTNERLSYSYGSGLHTIHLRGQVITENLRIGHVQTAVPTKIMLIDSTRSSMDSNWTTTGDSARIRSNHFRNLAGILGFGLRYNRSGKGVYSPLSKLAGSGKFIIKFPYFGGTRGKLIINPSGKEQEGFMLFHLKPGKSLLPDGTQSWQDNQLSACLIIDGASFCQPTLLDSGNPDIQLFLSGFNEKGTISSGSFITMEVKDLSDSAKRIKAGFLIPVAKERGKDYVYFAETTTEQHCVFGIRIFFEFNVLYDSKNGIIGLRRR